MWRKDELGKEAVNKYGEIVDKEAKAQGVDPNLVKAILYYENADGHKFGGNAFADKLGWSGSVMPMNINPNIWKGNLGPAFADGQIKIGQGLVERFLEGKSFLFGVNPSDA